MTPRILLAALSLPLAPVPAVAEEATPYEAVAGELRIVHLWTTDPDGFLQAWSQPTPPQLETTTKAVRNQPIHQFILYANCTRDDHGRCHLTARVAISAPDGSAYGEPMVFEALPLSPAAPPGSIGMVPQSIGLTVEDGEQLGTYRVELTVTDEIGAVTATNVAKIEVSESGETGP